MPRISTAGSVSCGGRRKTSAQRLAKADVWTISIYAVFLNAPQGALLI